MEDIFNGNFYNPTCGNLSLKEVIKETIGYMSLNPEFFYSIVVGCDSSSGENPNFPIALVILKKSQGGRFFLKKINYSKRKFYGWKERILQEVLLSCQIALVLKEKIAKEAENLPLNYEFKYIHADVGENGITKDMIKEVVGLIKGNGFEPKLKPESFAASNVADRYS